MRISTAPHYAIPQKLGDFERQSGVMYNDVTLPQHQTVHCQDMSYQYVLLLLLDPSTSIHDMVSQGSIEAPGISLNLTVSFAVTWQLLKARRKEL